MLRTDKKCYCGKVIDKRYYEKHRKGSCHKRILKERRKEPVVKEAPKIANFYELLN